MKRLFAAVATALLLLGCATSSPDPSQGTAAAPEAEPPELESDRIGGFAPRQIIAMFGARGRDGVTDRQVASYRRVFGFGDRDRDGRHSKKEYVDDGVYMTRRARQGIFRAADANNDGFVSRAEYVDNRIITDEAKKIFNEMDADGNGRLTAAEFMASEKIEDKSLAAEVFKALDTSGNGELVIPEYLRVWGRWARS